MIDEKVLKLNNYLKNHEFNRTEVAKLLDITERQLSRLLKKWEASGYIMHSTGIGRGNRSMVQMQSNIEQLFINQVLNEIKTLSLEEVEDLMQLPLSAFSKKIILTYIEDGIYKHAKTVQDDQPNVLVDYLYRIPKDFDPLQGVDVAASVIIQNIMDRLYEYNDKQEITSRIVAYDVWEEDGYKILINRNHYFSNGQLLNAQDVVTCLNRLFEHPLYKHLYENVIKAEALTTFSLKIYTKRKMANIQLLLMDSAASIYKCIDDVYYGTGPFFVHKVEDEMIVLRRNEALLTNPAELSELYIVSDREMYMEFFKEHNMIKGTDKNISFVNNILFNPNTTLSLNDRRKLCLLIIEYFEKRFANNTELFIRLFDDIKGYLSQFNLENYRIEKTIKLLYINYINPELKNIYEHLIFSGLDIERVNVSFDEYTKTNLNKFDVDFIFMLENIDINHYFFNMLQNSKFKDWYTDIPESRILMTLFNEKHNAYWHYAEEKLGRYLIEEMLFLPLMLGYRKYYLPQQFKSNCVGANQFFDYSKVFVV